MHVSGYRVAMDIGGTFTDFVVVNGDEHGETSSGKVLTTPTDPAEGVLEGLRQFVPEPMPSTSSCTARPLA